MTSLDHPPDPALYSDEYLSFHRPLAEHLGVLYRALLLREPRADETAAWFAYLSPPSIEDQFIDGPEFAVRWRLISSAP